MSKRKRKIGRYEPIRIMQQSTSATPGVSGYTAESEVEFVRRQGRVVEMTGREGNIANQMQSDTTHLVFLHSDRRTRDVTPKYWIRLRDTTRLNITRIRQVGDDGLELEFQCNERD